jgi:hypothetical protein
VSALRLWLLTWLSTDPLSPCSVHVQARAQQCHKCALSRVAASTWVAPTGLSPCMTQPGWRACSPK